jgi:hypothetical protein
VISSKSADGFEITTQELGPLEDPVRRNMQKAVARILSYLRSILRHYFVGPFSFHGTLPYKLAYLKARAQHKHKLTILCYPQVPRSVYVLYKLAHFAGCRITGNPKARHDLVVRFEDTTYASIGDVLSQLAERTDVLNARCTDISKKRVDAISTPIFGRSLMIDPLTYCGECLMKSDNNSAKDGKVIMCPIAKAIPGYVYQRIINNRMGSLVQDIRVPIIGGKIPFVYLIYESIKTRFFGGTVYVEMAETLDVLSSEEVENLIHFCGEFGLDYGELDVLRDGEDGFLYVLDANNTPTGPCRLLTKKERHDALSILAETFDKVFSSQMHADLRSLLKASNLLSEASQELKKALEPAERSPTALKSTGSKARELLL